MRRRVLMSQLVFENLIELAKNVHESHSEVREFCKFPNDLKTQEVKKNHINASHLLQADKKLVTNKYALFRDAFVSAAPYAHWRETYKNTDIGEDFMNRFGCYCLIGINAPFFSNQMHAFVVYMPEEMFYPWHNHPGEEMYLTLAGEAEFFKHNENNKVLKPGDVSEHRSNQPHAMRTHNRPVMAYVIWRNHFDTPPVWTDYLNNSNQN